MSLFLPQIILGTAFLILLGGNLFQRDFRSSWLLAVSGAGLSFASLFFLRFRLPLSSGFSAWWAGEGLVSSISFLLDGVSWQIALVSAGLVLSFFLTEVRHAMSAPWLNWAVNLALGISSLLAVFSADLLTLAFFWILIDLVTTLAWLRFVTRPEERWVALNFLLANIAASFLLLSAWILLGFSSQFGNLLTIVSTILRLGVISSSPASRLDSNQTSYLRLLPMASVLVLLSRPLALEGVTLIAMLAFLLPLAFFNALRVNQPADVGQGVQFVERGFATLTVMAAAVGQPTIALSLGLVTLVVGSLLSLAKSVRSWRWPIILVTVFFLCGLPFATIEATSRTALILLVFLPVYAALVSGWARSALGEAPEVPVNEPWMGVIRTLGLLIIPSIFGLLAIGLAPAPSNPIQTVWWPGIALIALTALIFFAGRRASRLLHVSQSLIASIESVVFSRWLPTAFEWILGALGWVLRMMNRVLEGQAGVLWALLLIALLLSLASQFALGG